jgi:diguanylate cyclase (GGDEF)-like protein
MLLGGNCIVCSGAVLVLSAPQHEDLAKLAVQRGARDYLLNDRLDDHLLPKALRSMVERAANAEALFEEKERAEVTLNSIGDAVMSSDVSGKVTYLNVVAESMTGWSREEAADQRLEDVFRIVDMVFHDVSTTRALSLRTSYLAQHDSLTNLPNRTVLNDRLVQATALAHRHGQQLAVLFLDVDRFKQINDSLGHEIGDRLLRDVSQRLLGCVRNSDTVSRHGGDEFVILLSEVTHAADAAVCAEKILLALSAPYCIDEHKLHLTASIGIAAYPDDGTDAQTLMKHADFAMYHAKDVNGLRRALERRQFELYYQPIVSLQTRALEGVEALVRWRHPLHGLVPPAQFVPIAEESGLIVAIGRWVLREACRQARAWQDAHLPAVRVAVNISTIELRHKDFVAGVRTILAETCLAPCYLELELTETVLMQDSTSTAAVLHSLKELGIQLALDDFGTGYSSLSHLKRFPIDALKIDHSFVRDLATNAQDAIIVGLVVSMGKALHMRVVAEGVETSEQLAALQRHACPLGQGHCFGKAMDASEFSGLLKRHAAQLHSSGVRTKGRSARKRPVHGSLDTRPKYQGHADQFLAIQWPDVHRPCRWRNDEQNSAPPSCRQAHCILR